MHIAQPALPADSKTAGATIDVRLASLVLSLIASRRPTAQLPLMLSVETVCLGEPALETKIFLDLLYSLEVFLILTFQSLVEIF